MIPDEKPVPVQRAASTRPEILVGTDGSAAAAAAVSYALDLAAAIQAPVRIAHVVPTHLVMPPGVSEAVLETGRSLLTDIERRAWRHAPTVEVRTSLLRGAPAVELVAAARDAELVVLGRSSRLSHLVTGSTARALVEHTDRPVRVVPADWGAGSVRSEVVVGVKDPRCAHALFERGFEIAAQLGEPLVLLHAWGLPTGYDEALALADSAAWNQQLTEQIAAELGPIRSRYPTVPYQIRVVHGRIATALHEASRRAAFLLVGRPAHLVLNVSDCPVEAGPALHVPAPQLDLELESDGHLLK
ncbi:universal stress protein [Methylocystis sp.]|uniref:universal stress protein n=1 Tax=Methylocystis sp. TaxID=1911079 RepID=UPI003DA1DEFF